MSNISLQISYRPSVIRYVVAMIKNNKLHRNISTETFGRLVIKSHTCKWCIFSRINLFTVNKGHRCLTYISLQKSVGPNFTNKLGLSFTTTFSLISARGDTLPRINSSEPELGSENHMLLSLFNWPLI